MARGGGRRRRRLRRSRSVCETRAHASSTMNATSRSASRAWRTAGSATHRIVRARERQASRWLRRRRCEAPRPRAARVCAGAGVFALLTASAGAPVRDYATASMLVRACCTPGGAGAYVARELPTALEIFERTQARAPTPPELLAAAPLSAVAAAARAAPAGPRPHVAGRRRRRRRRAAHVQTGATRRRRLGRRSTASRSAAKCTAGRAMSK